MRVLVCGDRRWTDREELFEVLDDFHAHWGITQIIEGCANGADRIAGWPCPGVKLQKGQPIPLPGWGVLRGVPVDHNPAEWHVHGKAAGPIRNMNMLRAKRPEYVLAFHPSFTTSKGTKHMVTIAREAGIPVEIFPNPHR